MRKLPGVHLRQLLCWDAHLWLVGALLNPFTSLGGELRRWEAKRTCPARHPPLFTPQQTCHTSTSPPEGVTEHLIYRQTDKVSFRLVGKQISELTSWYLAERQVTPYAAPLEYRFNCTRKCTSGSHSSTSSPLIIAASRSQYNYNMTLLHALSFGCLVKENNTEGKTLLRGVDRLLYLKKRKYTRWNRMTNNWRDRR